MSLMLCHVSDVNKNYQMFIQEIEPILRAGEKQYRLDSHRGSEHKST